MGMSDGEVSGERELGNGPQGQAHADNGSGSCEERLEGYNVLDCWIAVSERARELLF